MKLPDWAQQAPADENVAVRAVRNGLKLLRMGRKTYLSEVWQKLSQVPPALLEKLNIGDLMSGGSLPQVLKNEELNEVYATVLPIVQNAGAVKLPDLYRLVHEIKDKGAFNKGVFDLGRRDFNHAVKVIADSADSKLQRRGGGPKGPVIVSAQAEGKSS